ncbi:hypothetical protein LTR10_016262 [Elasticomyces elasticus]|uniref:Uncharacterized protein n=1 Tax=Exophiala sideris TaxID=1016849 RepID=A0ABR0JN50_9EURO|nr:hypothetical protein LTR10_016262 [Elasticomyces elasticus]KAK5037905.1 hypothetical protein LTS07_001372 [Exophiala sideris]KAK5043888.1 hypothetical protein LTR13_000242 [Exophiala sideris]KAK5067387.1 hypothetical protein LTR69_001374 [Exophiala sideris]KAK5182720.1 hypothetical protein LTR44_005111 [Eurotiomycetes sp. CCFEE 6388]
MKMLKELKDKRPVSQRLLDGVLNEGEDLECEQYIYLDATGTITFNYCYLCDHLERDERDMEDKVNQICKDAGWERVHRSQLGLGSVFGVDLGPEGMWAGDPDGLPDDQPLRSVR